MASAYETGHNIILSKESNQNQIKSYFDAILQLSKSGKDFPVNLDHVWMLAYVEKGKAVRALKQEFIEGIDYQVLTQNGKDLTNDANSLLAQNGKQKTLQGSGGHNKVTYYISLACMEYLIARKVRPVFEVYRTVFHKAVEQAQYNIPQTYSQALLLAAQQAETIEQQSLTIQAQNEQIQQLEAASAYTQIVLQCKSLTPVTIIASDYGMAAHAFNKLLAGFGVQYRKADTWVLYSRYLGKGYTQTKTHTFTHSDGRQGACVTTHWTQKGRMFIYNFLKQHGVLPTIER